jgi:hypothetical protein
MSSNLIRIFLELIRITFDDLDFVGFISMEILGKFSLLESRFLLAC